MSVEREDADRAWPLGHARVVRTDADAAERVEVGNLVGDRISVMTPERADDVRRAPCAPSLLAEKGVHDLERMPPAQLAVVPVAQPLALDADVEGPADAVLVSAPSPLGFGGLRVVDPAPAPGDGVGPSGPKRWVQ
jgi:hypothetical protein